ncbi:unnamed protein product, partial [Penicillium manginii]
HYSSDLNCRKEIRGSELKAGLNEGSELCFLLGPFLTILEATEVAHLRFEVLISFVYLILNGVPEQKAL